MKRYGLLIVVALGVTMYAPTTTKAGPLKMLNEQAKCEHLAKVEQAADADASVTYAQIRDDLETVATALDAVATAIDAIDMSAIDPTAFPAGVQRTCIQNLKGNLNALKVATKDMKVAAKNLKQADSKLVRKLKEMERINEKYQTQRRAGN